MEDLKRNLHEYMNILAEACDGASTLDGVGFSKPDSYNGKFLASLPLGDWGEDESALAAEYSLKYSGQLGLVGSDITKLVKLASASSGSVTEKRRKKNSESFATLEGDLISSDTPYNSSFVAAASKIPSRRYAGGRINTFRTKDLDAVLRLFEEFGVEIRFEIPKKVENSPKEEKTSPNRGKTEKNNRKVSYNGKVLEISFPYDPKIVAEIKKLGLAKWNPSTKVWKIDLVHAEKLKKALQPYGFEFDGVIDSSIEQTKKFKDNHSLDKTSFREEIPGLRKEYDLLPHQWVPVESALKGNNILNADSQGLGKTITSLATISIKGSKRTVVVCPASLTSNWFDESQMFFEEGTFNVFFAEGFTPKDIPEESNLVIINWSCFQKWEKVLSEWNPEAIVVDEAHYGKSGKKSQRGEAFINFGAKKNPKAMKLALTGTPILNRPLELLAILQFFGIEKKFGGVTKFKNRYCGPKLVENAGLGYPVYTYNGATNLEELNDILASSGIYVRRTKKLLQEQGLLKKKYINGVEFFDYETTRNPTYVEFTPEEMQSYYNVENELRHGLELKKKEMAIELGLRPNHPLVKASLEGKKSGEALKLLVEFRKRVGLLKVRAIKEKIDKLVEQGEKVVVFAHHRDVVDAYSDEFGGLKIQGGMSSSAIKKAKEKFNNTPVSESPVLVCSIEAAKTGHTFFNSKLKDIPNCAHIIFAEEPYVYGDFEQASDRIFRVGQDRDVYIENLIAPGTVDEKIYFAREKKAIVFNSVIDGINLSEEDDESTVSGQILRGYL